MLETVQGDLRNSPAFKELNLSGETGSEWIPKIFSGKS